MRYQFQSGRERSSGWAIRSVRKSWERGTIAGCGEGGAVEMKLEIEIGIVLPMRPA